ncbi:ubiquitin carboxyl-terminal hydrolase [Nitzschia inconspicua]|uniref:Ubiquitin carboxyl-terminal hydrolase n=1 Tax=Nitzschia inconspicua TaxID=303405 RepID=A0A9K3PGK0_9STRA|nr:ubiquitin carboxyl-terminal hydrolase [Nitzschia inconspicua]
MVEFRTPHHVDDDDDDLGMETREDILNIANAYRCASDEDTRNVMNAMSNPTPENLHMLKFYAVPASWLLKVWPILSARLDTVSNIRVKKDQVGRILNAALVVNTEEKNISAEADDTKPSAVIPSHVTMNGNSNNSKFDEAKANMERFHRRRMIQKETTTQMKPGLQHANDYFFVGAHVWELIKMKFGYDGYELCRTSCKATTAASGSEEEQGVIAIALLPGEGMHAVAAEEHCPSKDKEDSESVVIPPTGRFPYEKILPTLKISENGDPALDSLIPDSRNNSNVVTWADDDEISESKEEENRIILLPASSTPINQPSSIPLFTNRMNDMDLDSRSDKDSGSGDGPQVSGRKRLASGLSNLGNTCFMNSTLQCLSNTEDLRRYFLSGDYLKDLNTDNPLGTGGQLATEFARLLGEMWGVPSNRRNVLGHTSYSNSYNSYSSYSSAVVPRDFKACVGRHAEQFMGYDQHDSQEFATYLLDALHEDTNRVSKKPYIEKPEQGEDEPDDIAAEKAWNLHLQREDSHVLENFMGQVKSRLECCEPGCNRVSTTFDPFMYLSVPIPGSTEKSVKVTFVPLDPNKKSQSLAVKVSKIGKISDLLDTLNDKLCALGFLEAPIRSQDLIVADLWHHEIFKLYDRHDDVGGINDNDNTWVYQLESLEEIKKQFKVGENSVAAPGWESKNTHRGTLDLQTRTKLNLNDGWMDYLAEDYSKLPRATTRILNPKQTTMEDRMELHKKLENFLDECHEILTKEETGNLKRARETLYENDEVDVMKMEDGDYVEAEPAIQGLVDRCLASEHFRNVRNKHDFSVLEFCANKLRQMILKQLRDDAVKQSEGIVVSVSFSKKGALRTERRVAPLVLRIPGAMTVYEFRQLVADRIARSLIVSHAADDFESGSTQLETSSGELSEETHEMNTGEPSSEAEEAERSRIEVVTATPQIEPSELLIMRRAALKYEKRGMNRSNRWSSAGSTKQLGMVGESSGFKLAMEDNESEQKTMDVVGPHGVVTVLWDEEYDTKVFNESEYQSVEKLADKSFATNDETSITVLDCIKKYCQKEQLEESEMWYCNKCKNHVRAWKQFHLHRTPPYLIVHLKRFYFSASSRRRDKISTFIDFPLEGLDLSELVADFDESTKPVYDCYAVSNHIGGLGGGHYTAHILSDDNQTWCFYNDSNVKEGVDKKEVVSAEAYVLYYRRRDVPVGQDKEYRIVAAPRQPSPMICETVSPIDQRSDASSNNTAQAGDLDATLDDVASHSSGGATSPMGSIDQGPLHGDIFGDADDDDLYSNDIQTDDNFPLQ